MSKTENNPPVTQTVDDDEPDDWLGNEVSGLAGGLTLFGAGTSESSAPDAQMEAFRECWKRYGNEQRTESKNS
ncbi:hypothetical protein EMCG_07627 [[Emmonsia] crescens]|uniref:Uncharacterized protein n=1 Tax=[Emmonsia] crescens TaxID=73230 RepID=A0A0G2I846_9EURO|nr:hypothetical protein EMCG_07627 [Emmonsia crescens UAMH 3008]